MESNPRGCRDWRLDLGDSDYSSRISGRSELICLLSFELYHGVGRSIFVSHHRDVQFLGKTEFQLPIMMMMLDFFLFANHKKIKIQHHPHHQHQRRACFSNTRLMQTTIDHCKHLTRSGSTKVVIKPANKVKSLQMPRALPKAICKFQKLTRQQLSLILFSKPIRSGHKKSENRRY